MSINIKLKDIKENQDFIVLEQINLGFKGIIVVFSEDKIIGYIIYDCSDEEWIFNNSINTSNCIYGGYDNLPDLLNRIKQEIYDVSIKAINFSEYE